MLVKEKCVMVSCGFESCVTLVSSGSVYSWGYGGSGALGHSNYDTQEKPKKIEGLQDIIYTEAGGYHSGAINKDGEVFTWGRGDVGQLALTIGENGLTKDEMGLVALTPQKVDLGIQVKQIALGDAHSLFLSLSGKVFSCGWYELGQLGISQEQIEADERDKKLTHLVSSLDYEVK
jgi:regulator of chromosome condensation